MYIDSVATVKAENGTLFQLQHVNVPDTLFLRNNTEIIPHTRSIIENVGFGEGGLHYTHHWEIGGYICDEFANYVGKLRCFEQNGTVYNFVGYPCDSSWVISSLTEMESPSIQLLPNPVSTVLEVNSAQTPTLLIIRTLEGNVVRIIENARSVDVQNFAPGYYLIEVHLAKGIRKVLPWIKI